MEKRLRKSPVVIALYVLAALAMVYSCYLIGSTISYINSYYSQYGMSAKAGETISYVLQTVFQPFTTAVLLYAGGAILSAVRALNPANYATEDEIAKEKAAKKAAKAEKKADNVVAEADEVVVFGEKAEETVKADITMKKSELLKIAKELGVEVSDRATKAEILEAIEK
ncbi:MAG: hypothetical protein KBS63_01440 [Clostridiales bacterium]|nr:hypothetical protein [Candidatus Crickella caballi]